MDLNRLNLNFGYQIAKHLSINTGPVLNIYVTKLLDPTTNEYGFDWGQSPFWSETYDDVNVSMWVGYQVSMRF